MNNTVRKWTTLLLCSIAAWPAAAYAADEEIQVYVDDMSDPGEIGLDTHVNYVFSGESTVSDYSGAQDSLHRLRVTPEFSYGTPPGWRPASISRWRPLIVRAG